MEMITKLARQRIQKRWRANLGSSPSRPLRSRSVKWTPSTTSSLDGAGLCCGTNIVSASNLSPLSHDPGGEYLVADQAPARKWADAKFFVQRVAAPRPAPHARFGSRG